MSYNKFKKPIVAVAAISSLLQAQAEDIVAVYDLQGQIYENGNVQSSPLELLGRPERPLTHFDLVESLNFAATDDNVKAVVLDIDDAGIGLAQLQELRRLLLAVRAKNKDVWLYAKSYNLSTAVLGSAANHFCVMPEGGSSFKGLFSESMYFKGLLDKVGVAIDVIHIGDFKSAGEQFYRNGPSEPAQKQAEELLDSLFDQIVDQIATGRKVSKESVLKIIDQGNVTTTQLKEAKLIDHGEYRTDFIKKIKSTYAGAEFDKNFELPNTSGPKISGMMDFFKLMGNSKSGRDLTQPYIAIIPLEGAITDDSIAIVRKEVIRATKNPMCKAMILRVNSPGGSAFASEVLWEATDEFKKTKRPFVVSMGGVAASGGYYVSAAADKIFAEPGTVTGSIGVVGMKPAIGEAMNKLGITTHSMKRGKHADLYNTTSKFTDEERKVIRDSMLDVYATFKKRIKDGRGDRIKGELEKLAGGRVYSGNQALEIGLIDQVGGLNEAIEHCIDACEDENLYTFLFPEPKSPVEIFLTPPSPDDNGEFIQHQAKQDQPLFGINTFRQQALSLFDDHKKHQFDQFLTQLKSLKENQIQLISPVGLKIKTK